MGAGLPARRHAIGRRRGRNRHLRDAAPPFARRLDRLTFGDRARSIDGNRIHGKHAPLVRALSVAFRRDAPAGIGLPRKTAQACVSASMLSGIIWPPSTMIVWPVI